MLPEQVKKEEPIIPANSKIELIVMQEGQLIKKIARVQKAVKNYIFEKAASRKRQLVGYQILSS